MKKKKRIIIASVILCIGIVLISAICIKVILTDKQYVVDIPDISKIVKISYTDVRGDLYEIDDKGVIAEFIDSVNKKEFTKERDYSHSSFSSESIRFYDEAGNRIYALQVLNEREILNDSYSYVMEGEMLLDMLREKGTFIENIHK